MGRNVVNNLALYRKYRSGSLSDVIGQSHITDILENALRSGNISHAYLLAGPKGVGKTSVARILAHAINDIPYDPLGTPPIDIIEIDAASNRRIDEIRDLREKIHISPVSAKYKVYIIDEVHMLTKEAFNALLKTLEEPPGHAVFILATTEVHKLPDTIVSRTQHHTFRPIPKPDLISHLKLIAKSEKIKIDQEALELIADHGAGSFRDSISLLDQIRSTTKSQIRANDIETALGNAPKLLIKRLVEATFAKRPSDVLDILNQIAETGATPQQAANQCMQYLHVDISKSRQPATIREIIILIDELQDVAGASNQQLKLETIMIGFCVRPSTKPYLEENTKMADVLRPQPAKKVNDPDKKNSQKNQNTDNQSWSSKLNEETWSRILQEIKTVNNPLCAVLRMAKPTFSDSTLRLDFQFPFHKNRVNEQKNETLLHNLVKKYVGEDVNIEAYVVTDQTAPARAASNHKSEPTPEMSAVIDIMGGGEAVYDI